MANNFDLSALALQGLCPSNEILYDDAGYPSIMVKIPKMTYAQLGMGESNAVHPAFIVNGSEIDAIWISKYENVVYNSRAYSLPGRDPMNSVSFTNAVDYCSNKGEGWHLMTRMEWGLIGRWCEANGYMPLGNTDNGKDPDESVYKAIPMALNADGDAIGRCATGTGPLAWSHNGEPDGIFDMKGNVSEWVGGVRCHYGELQVLANNNAADSEKSQSSSSTEWKAISASDGSLITPDGSGTTDGSVKMNYTNSRLVYDTEVTGTRTGTISMSTIQFADSICDDAKLIIQSLYMAPYSDSDLGRNYSSYIANTSSDRLFYCGGNYNLSAYGLPAFHGGNTRSGAYINIGFRSAYCDLPSA